MYSLFFSATATALQAATGREQWVAALKHGIDAISKYGGAEVGDRTMVNMDIIPVFDVEEIKKR